MNGTLFMTILVGGSLLTALLTQAIKQFYYNKDKDAPPNLIALVNAVVVGGLGTAVVYIWLDIAWDIKNILALLVLILFTWIGSMIGYTKIFESIQQFMKWRESFEIAKMEERKAKSEAESEEEK